MEKKTEAVSGNVVSEGDSLDSSQQYTSPDVAAAQAGEVVDFTMDVNSNQEDPENDA